MSQSIVRRVVYATLAIFALCAWLFVGVVTVDRMEDEGYHDIFIKKSPTFRVSFFDSYKSDAIGEESEYRKREDANGDWLPGTYELNEFLSYCKYRYGITVDDQEKARSLCKIANTRN
ncbi:hypothetical protein [Collimonas silvisoli]|uniref:hypothetical protein n=1 Tax=Collimonas silvisoli TaxID=2825884 RepID=UPI001B8D4D56|nr:hypothetical protein [Collimonas silvisoli]